MEHLDFNVGSDTMPLLREAWFRQAVAYAVDRTAVAAASVDTSVSNHPALHNLSFSSIEPDYEPVFAHYVYDLQTVAGLMGAHGCTRAADGIWSCGGIRASVKFATTTGNAARARAAADGRAGEGGGYRTCSRQLPPSGPLRHEAGRRGSTS